MASQLLGRAPCPECGFEHAHIKIKTDKEGARPYRHCPGCGAQYFPRNDEQEENLRKQIAPSKITQDTPSPVPAPAPKPPEKKQPQPEQDYEMVLGVRVPKRRGA